MKDKIEKCSEGGEGIIINPRPSFVLPNDYTRCNFVDCPAIDCFRLRSYQYGIENNQTMSVVDFSEDNIIIDKEDCKYYI
jgi:hypothetical protein